MKKILLIFNFFAIAVHAFFDPIPYAKIPNSDPSYSLLNSVDFHPRDPIFCVVHSQANQIAFYKIEEGHEPILIQTFKRSRSQLRGPQHAVFSSDGNKLVVANWNNLSINVYPRKRNGLFSEKLQYSASFPKALETSKPHGIAFSPSGRYLAIACGATSDFTNGLVVYEHKESSLHCISFLVHDQLWGTPKGICFTPDSTCLLVSFCEPPCLAIFQLEEGHIQPIPKQILAGADTELSRPEDIKLTSDHSACAVSNSGGNTITFYHFDKNSNAITDSTPFYSLSHSELIFPHGIAFSADGTFLAITLFGHLQFTPEGKFRDLKNVPPHEGKVYVFKSALGPILPGPNHL